MIREVHHSFVKFTSIDDMKRQIMKEFESQLPETADFQIGYYSGKSSKKWIVTEKDLESMYTYKNEQTKFLLWCDARISQPQPPKIDGASSSESDTSKISQKRHSSDSNPPLSKRRQIEIEVDSIVSDLKQNHGSKYTYASGHA